MTTSALMTPAPKLRVRQGYRDIDPERQCGYWLEAESDTWTTWCGSGTRCAIATYATPNIVFCPNNELPPYTEIFAYGEWPQGGCQSLQMCCGTDSAKVLVYEFDGGASTIAECAPAARNDLPSTLTLFTSLGTLSAQLSVYTPPYSITVRPATSTTSTTSATSAATSSSTGSPAGKDGGLSTEAKIGIGVGVPAAVFALIGLFIMCLK